MGARDAGYGRSLSCIYTCAYSFRSLYSNRGALGGGNGTYTARQSCNADLRASNGKTLKIAVEGARNGISKFAGIGLKSNFNQDAYQASKTLPARIRLIQRIIPDVGVKSAPRHEFIVMVGIFPMRFSG